MTNQTPHNKRLESASSPDQIRTLPINHLAAGATQ
jgi:hypothetical protein